MELVRFESLTIKGKNGDWSCSEKNAGRNPGEVTDCVVESCETPPVKPNQIQPVIVTNKGVD